MERGIRTSWTFKRLMVTESRCSLALLTSLSWNKLTCSRCPVTRTDQIADQPLCATGSRFASSLELTGFHNLPWANSKAPPFAPNRKICREVEEGCLSAMLICRRLEIWVPPGAFNGKKVHVPQSAKVSKSFLDLPGYRCYPNQRLLKQ